MKKYKIYTEEKEVWTRTYLIEADNEEEAKDKAINGDNDGSDDGECGEFQINVLEIEEI